MKRYLLILGANSDMARAIAVKYAENGYNLYLAVRNVEQIKLFANDLAIRQDISVAIVSFDALNFRSHQTFYKSLNPKPKGVISTIGYLGDQKKSQFNFDEAKNIINTNYLGIVSIFNIIAKDFEEKKEGFIIGVSSVAGDRGKKSNYTYGSAKAAFSTYLSGLRNRLESSNVKVMTVKPGFVFTKMTETLDLPKRLTASPEEVANDILKAHKKNKNIIYTKWFWRYIMSIIKLIPEFKFKKMNL